MNYTGTEGALRVEKCEVLREYRKQPFVIGIVARKRGGAPVERLG